MGLFSFLGHRKSARSNVSQEDHRRLASAFSQLKTHVSNQDAQIQTVQMVLNRHEHAIDQCRDLADRNSRKLLQLEDLVDRSPAVSTPSVGPCRHANGGTPMRPTVPSVPAAGTQQLDINRFSEQQKRLLAVFFQNRDRQLSYADVAVRMGRSPCTIKNQINKIRRKADLFECSSGPQNRNYFRLKDDLRVESLLRVGRSWDQPGPTAWPDPAEPEAVPARDSFSYPTASTQQ